MRAKVQLEIDTSLLRPGMRLAIGLSGGADSVALLLALAERSAELGLVLHAAHLHHGLRGAEADEDLEFCRALAAKLGTEFHEAHVDTAAESRSKSQTLEEAARRLRYGWFRQLLASGLVDAIATAHTLDDQAETVLSKFLRGAWTEGLSGIHPVLEFPEGRILRPLLSATRAQVEAYLRQLGQSWREDSSNRHLTFTRNRIRHELLPLLETWNPRLREHMAEMAVLACDEEAWWQAEIKKIAPQVILPGRPVRGGGRAAGDGVAIEVGRLAALPAALQRRLLRSAAAQLGAAPDFAATEALRMLALKGRAGQKLELAHGLLAERTARELRIAMGPISTAKAVSEAIPKYTGTVPGEIAGAGFGIRLRIDVSGDGENGSGNGTNGTGPESKQTACLRNWRAGDRVRLRYSNGPRKVKEVLERLKVTGSARAVWPVLELGGRIVWMKGVELEPEPGIVVTVETLQITE